MWRRLSLGLAIIVLPPAVPAAVALAGDAEDGSHTTPGMTQSIDRAIDRGVDFLFQEIESAAGWTPGYTYPAGYIALQIYALVQNDVSYAHPAIQHALRQLKVTPTDKVYSVSLTLMALGAVLDEMDAEAADRALTSIEFFPAQEPPLSRSQILTQMRGALSWLIAARVRGEGTWYYESMMQRRGDPRRARSDHSNSQFAILALGVAERVGLKVPRKVWQEIADHFVKYQEPTGDPVTTVPVFAEPPPVPKKKKTQRSRLSWSNVGLREFVFVGSTTAARARGWGYKFGDGARRERDRTPRLSMTSAGQSSALLAYMVLSERYGRNQRLQALEPAIRDGFAWLTKYMKAITQLPFDDPYALYSLEKVGDLSGVERFGTFNWYERGAEVLCRGQSTHGGWGVPGTPMARHDTALSLLFLGRATSLDKSKRRLVRFTGSQSSDPVGFANRYFVYIPSLEAAVPMIRFFRTVRYRPTKRLLEVTEELLTVYDPDYHDELALFLLTLDRSPSNRIRSHGRTLLRRVTGLDTPDIGPYLGWSRDWKWAVEVGQKKSMGEAPGLRDRLRHSTSTPLRLRIISVLQQIGDGDALATLIEVMAAEDPLLRESAYGALKVLSEQRFPFDPNGTGVRRRSQIERWSKWLKERSIPEGSTPESRGAGDGTDDSPDQP